MEFIANSLLLKKNAPNPRWILKSFFMCKEFLTSITVFVIPRNIYLEVNCVYL